MYSIVIWETKDTLLPTIIGPYESDLVFDDADLLKKAFHKVLVGQITTPEKSDLLTFLSN